MSQVLSILNAFLFSASSRTGSQWRYVTFSLQANRSPPECSNVEQMHASLISLVRVITHAVVSLPSDEFELVKLPSVAVGAYFTRDWHGRNRAPQNYGYSQLVVACEWAGSSSHSRHELAWSIDGRRKDEPDSSGLHQTLCQQSAPIRGHNEDSRWFNVRNLARGKRYMAVPPNHDCLSARCWAQVLCLTSTLSLSPT